MKLEELICVTLSLPTGSSVKASDGPGTVEGWDSLGHISIISALESTYQISISMDEAMMLEKISDIKDLLHVKQVLEF